LPVTNGWVESTLGNFLRIKHGWAFKGKYFADSGSFVLLTPGNFRQDGGLQDRGEREKFYDGEFPPEFLLKRGDLLIVMTDLTQDAPILGSPAFVPFSDKYLHNQRLGKVVDLDESRLTNKFLYYLLNLRSVREQIKATATGATVRHTAPERIYSVRVKVPPLCMQRRITSFLSAYDQLIGNTTCRIEILEEMVSMIYREWFVKFRFPGYEKVKIVESEIGPIPDGWKVVELAALYKTGSGGTPSRKVGKYFGGCIPWVKTSELNDGFIVDTEEKITEAGLKYSSAKLFPPRTVLMAMYGATIGKLGILTSAATCNQACCAMSENVEPFGAEYLFLTLRHKREAIVGLRMGAAQQNISQQVIRSIRVLRPKEEVISSFNRFARAMFDELRMLTQKNINLRKTRDLLLPKLVSGEIDVERSESEAIAQSV
jgi:type I restriction enzyme S subunit